MVGTDGEAEGIMNSLTRVEFNLYSRNDNTYTAATLILTVALTDLLIESDEEDPTPPPSTFGSYLSVFLLYFEYEHGICLFLSTTVVGSVMLRIVLKIPSSCSSVTHPTYLYLTTLHSHLLLFLNHTVSS